ncbi:potassium transporter TrkG [Escherichia coli]
MGLDSLPHAILFYRQMLQWYGGGIIVLAVAIALSSAWVGCSSMAGMPGPLKDDECAQYAETAEALWFVYVLLTVACALALWFAEDGCL